MQRLSKENRRDLLFVGVLGLIGLSIYAAQRDSEAAGRRRDRRIQDVAAITWDGGPDGGDAQTDAADGGDAQAADGGDAAAADGGDAQAADGGDAAAADGGDATPDGGDAQVSPLDRAADAGTLVAEWNFIGFPPDAGAAHNPLTKYAGSCSGTNCNVTEFSAPNWVGGYQTTGLTYIGARKDQRLFNGSSGGWGQSAWTGPGTLTFPILVRAIVTTGSMVATREIFWSTTTANAALFKLFTDSTPRFLCQYDDGPGSTVQNVISAGISAGMLAVADCYVDATQKLTLCVNGVCTSASGSAGSTSYAPDTIGILASNANTQIWDGYATAIQLHQNVSWWNTSVAASDYTLLTAGP